jgi:type II secretory pathway pseudopilin PulG
MRKIITRKTDRSRTAGFTILEILIATVILLVGIIGVAEMVPRALDMDLRNRDSSSGIMAAQRQLEQMLKLPIDVTSGGSPTDYSFLDNDGNVDYVGALPIPAIAGPTQAPPGPVQSGCPLTNGLIDFSQVCNATGYSRQVTPGFGPNFDVRWNVITFYGNDNGTIRPVLKRIAIAGRATDGSLSIPTTLNVLVAP